MQITTWNRRRVLALVLAAGSLFTGGAGAQQPENQLAGLHVALDVGHSKSAVGAKSARGRGEFYFNQATARVIADTLRDHGAKVTVINDAGNVTSLAARPQTALASGADVFISVHHDSVNDRYLSQWRYMFKKLDYCDRFRGYSVFCSSRNLLADTSKSVALAVGAAMKSAGFPPTLHHNEAIKGENRPLVNRDTAVYNYEELVVLKSARIPSILLECGVIVHRQEELDCKTHAYQQRIGHAVASGLATCVRDGVLKPKAAVPQ